MSSTPSSTQPVGRILQKYHVTLNVDPNVLARLPETTFQFLMGNRTGGNSKSNAMLSNFSFGGVGGGPSGPASLNPTAKGDFSSGFTLQCWPESPQPQVLFELSATTTKMDFDISISTMASSPDWFTVWVGDLSYDPSCFVWPTTASNQSLFASIYWGPNNGFRTANYTGNGIIPGSTLSDSGFSGVVT